MFSWRASDDAKTDPNKSVKLPLVSQLPAEEFTSPCSTQASSADGSWQKESPGSCRVTHATSAPETSTSVKLKQFQKKTLSEEYGGCSQGGSRFLSVRSIASNVLRGSARNAKQTIHKVPQQQIEEAEHRDAKQEARASARFFNWIFRRRHKHDTKQTDEQQKEVGKVEQQVSKVEQQATAKTAYGMDLATLTPEQLSRWAKHKGVSMVVITQAGNKQDPKAFLIEAIMLHAALSKQEIGELRQQALREGVNAEEVEEAASEDNAKVAVIDLIMQNSCCDV